MRCSAAQTCVHGISFFSSRYDVPRGVPVLGHGDTKSLGVGCERSHSGAKGGIMACQESLASITLVEMLFLRALFDNDNHPESLKTALISSRCKTAAPP
jgi:hypothetical protein